MRRRRLSTIALRAWAPASFARTLIGEASALFAVGSAIGLVVFLFESAFSRADWEEDTRLLFFCLGAITALAATTVLPLSPSRVRRGAAPAAASPRAAGRRTR